MRIVWTILIGSVTLALTAGAASATHSSGQGPKHDFGIGTGIVLSDFEEAEIHVNAIGEPTPTGPTGAKGHFFIRHDLPPGTPFRDFRGEVTCLSVLGNDARIGGRITHTDPTLPSNPMVGQGVLINISDNGDPRDQPPDAVNYQLVSSPPMSCPLPFNATAPIDQGNYVVHNAP